MSIYPQEAIAAPGHLLKPVSARKSSLQSSLFCHNFRRQITQGVILMKKYVLIFFLMLITSYFTNFAYCDTDAPKPADKGVVATITDETKTIKSDVKRNIRKSKDDMARDIKDIKEQTPKDFKKLKDDIVDTSKDAKDGAKQELKDIHEGLKKSVK